MLNFKRKKFSNGKGNDLSKGIGNQMHGARIGATASDFCTWKKDLGTIVAQAEYKKVATEKAKEI